MYMYSIHVHVRVRVLYACTRTGTYCTCTCTCTRTYPRTCTVHIRVHSWKHTRSLARVVHASGVLTNRNRFLRLGYEYSWKNANSGLGWLRKKKTRADVKKTEGRHHARPFENHTRVSATARSSLKHYDTRLFTRILMCTNIWRRSLLPPIL